MNAGTKQLLVAIDFHSIVFFCTIEVNGYRQLFGAVFFNISSFVFNISKKLIQVWNDMRVSKWWQNYSFWVNCKVIIFLKYSTQELDHWVSVIQFMTSNQKIMTNIFLTQSCHMTSENLEYSAQGAFGRFWRLTDVETTNCTISQLTQ